MLALFSLCLLCYWIEGGNKDGERKNGSRGDEEDHDDDDQERLDKERGMVTVAETDCDEYYSQYLQGTEGASTSVHKDMPRGSDCGFSGRKDAVCSSESVESLRAVLSDPIT